ncbi:MAG: excisionase family DNA-binding protein [Acidimicrobiales bacterium]
MTTYSAARQLSCSTRTIRRAIEDGRLTAHRVNGYYRIQQSDFDQFAAGRKRGGRV